MTLSVLLGQIRERKAMQTSLKLKIFFAAALTASINGVHAQSCDGRTETMPTQQWNCAATPAASAKSIQTKQRTQPPVVTVNCTASNSNLGLDPLRLSSDVLNAKAQENSCGPSPKDVSWPILLAGIAWPLAFLIAMFFYGRQRVIALVGKVTRFKGGGFEIEFNPKAAEKVRTSVSGTLKSFVEAAHQAYARQAFKFSVKDHLEQALTRALPLLTTGNPKEYRATIHVSDVVYADYMYQLLNYFPRGGGVGRRFSKRRGILGKVWRLNESVGVGNVIAYDRGPFIVAGAPNPEETLVREWSMTREEIRGWHQASRLSFLCVVLRIPYEDGEYFKPQVLGRKVGVLYIDSSCENAFGIDSEALTLANKLEGTPEVVALARAVENAMQKMRESNIDLKIDNE